MNENEIMDLMNDISYGFVDKNGIKHVDEFESFSTDYILQDPNSILKSKVGVCWDQVELERYYFEKTSYSFKTYYIVYYNNSDCPTHTFLTYEKNNKIYWFEYSWEEFRGIHEYENIDDLLVDVKNKFIESLNDKEFNINNLKLYEYSKPEYFIGVEEFCKHCEQGKVIN